MKNILSLTIALIATICPLCAQESIIEPAPTPATAAERHAASIQRQATISYAQLIAAYNRMMREFWNSKDATPQEICDALGSKAASLFMLGHELKTFILAVDPAAEERLVVQPYEATLNQDGTVTILIPEPDPEP